MLIGTQFKLAHKNLVNLFMTVTTNVILFLKKILAFLQMFPPGSFKLCLLMV